MIETCGECGEEIRFGIRPPIPTSRWLHVEEVDHPILHGTRAEHDWSVKLVAGELVHVDDEEVPEEPLPEPEVRARDIAVEEFAPRSGIRQIYNLIGRTEGWEIVSMKHSRGPRLGALGGSLGIADCVVIRAREAPGLDGSVRIAVASWLDGKFDFAYIGTIADGQLAPVAANSQTMKAWIKGDLPDPVQRPEERSE